METSPNWMYDMKDIIQDTAFTNVRIIDIGLSKTMNFDRKHRHNKIITVYMKINLQIFLLLANDPWYSRLRVNKRVQRVFRP